MVEGMEPGQRFALIEDRKFDCLHAEYAEVDNLFYAPASVVKALL
jgi:hypothetical protein